MNGVKDVVEAVRARVARDPHSPPCDERAIQEAEAQLGFGLPPALRAIYASVANGGFGPGYGVMGVGGGFTDDLGHTATALYQLYREPDPEDPAWSWKAGWLPFCHWGCGVYSVVDCMTPGNPVFFVDPTVRGVGDAMDTVTRPHKPSLDAWLDDWLAGKDLWGEVWGTGQEA